MNKLTDSELEKALENCTNDIPQCTTCKYDADTITCDECMGKLMEDAFDLIKRQKAEIVELRKGFTADMDYFASEYDSKIKAEAIKEFAERLKAVSHPYADTQMVFELQIDNLVKEMVGD